MSLFKTVCLLFICGLSTSAHAQHVTSDRELDRFKTCTFGITLVSDTDDLTIERVWPGLAGEIAGLKPGDKIVQMQKQPLTADAKSVLRDFVKSTVPGTRVDLTVLRDGESMDIILRTDSQATLNARVLLDHLRSNSVIANQARKAGTGFVLADLQKTLISDVRAAPTPRRAMDLMNLRLDELKVSHFGVIPKAMQAVAFQQKNLPNAGIELRLKYVDGLNRYFASYVDKSVVARGINTGDEIVRINGVPSADSSRIVGFLPEYSVFVDSDDSLDVDIRSELDGPVRTVKLPAISMSTSISKTTASVELIERDDFRIGSIHLVDFMSFQVASVLRNAIANEFKDSDGLIVDLRGHGGLVPIGMQVEKTLSSFGKPVFALIDGHTSSAKEICAYRLRKLKNVTLVGTKTSGSVLGATVLPLPSGDGLLYPGVGEEMLGAFLDKQSLEGKGVEPDLLIAEKLCYSNGKNELFKKSIAAMISHLTEARATTTIDAPGATSVRED